MQQQNTRRNFLKYSTLAGLGIAVNPFGAASKENKMTEGNDQIWLKKGQQIVSLLQTTDVHCQLHPHDELFWEDEKAVFRKAGGYASNTTPDPTGNIPITQGYIYDMLPVNSIVRTGKVTGSQLRDWLEKELNNVFAKDASKRLGGWVVKFKGMTVEFKAFEELGKRIQSIIVNDEALDSETLYVISACEREGDPEDVLCRMQNVKEASNTPFTLHEVIKDYLTANSPVTPKPEGNAIILDAPATILTQVHGVDYRFV